MSTDTWTGAINNDWSIPANWSGDRIPQTGDVVAIPPDSTAADATVVAPVLNQGTLVGEHLKLLPQAFTPTAVVFDGATLGSGSSAEGGYLELAPGGTLAVGADAVLGPNTVVQPQDYDTAPQPSPASLVNDGLIASSPLGQVELNLTSLVNDGTIVANGNALSIDGTVSGSGMLHVRDGGLLSLGSAGGSPAVTFDDGTGTLVLPGPASGSINTGTIAGFQSGDTITLSVFGTLSGLSYADGTLDVRGNGSLYAAIPLAGPYASGDFALRPVFSHGGVTEYQITTTAAGPDTPPSLTLPGAEQVVAGDTIDVLGVSYVDRLESTAPGTMHLVVTAGSGTLAATDASGAAIAGSGSGTLSLTDSYAAIDRALASLTYSDGSSGSDSIGFAITDQTGHVTTGTLPVSVAAPAIPMSDDWTGAASSAWADGANWSTGSAPGADTFITIPGSTPHAPVLADATLNGDVVTLLASAGGQPALTWQNVTLGPQSLLQSGTAGGSPAVVALDGSLAIDPGALVAPEAGSELVLDTGAATTVVNNGLIALPRTGAASLAITGGTLVNHGSIGAANGVLTLGGTVAETVLNSGTISLANGGQVVLHGSVAGGTVAFGAASGPDSYGTLVLDRPMALTGGAQLAGFGLTDALDLQGAAAGNALGFVNGTLEISNNGSLTEAIPLAGTYGLGNFEIDVVGGAQPHSIVGYAPSQGTTGRGLADVVAPDIMAVTTLSLPQTTQAFDISDGVQDVPDGAVATLHITAQTGTLSMPGATGNGSNSLTLSGTELQLNTALPKLVYTAGLGAGSDTISIAATLGDSTTIRSIPVAVTNAQGPALAVTPAVSTGPGGSFALPASYLDVFAGTNPGQLYLSITDSYGTLAATTASGQAAPGSGTQAIQLATSDANVEAILNSLSYTASGNPAVTGDDVHYTVWNQAGAETSATTSIATGSGGGAPGLAEPNDVTVPAAGTVAVSGSYADAFAASNPGELYLDISDSAGTLQATNAAGQAVAGSGTEQIGLATDYVGVNAILASLQYTADAAGTPDTIRFHVWDQAGQETDWTTAVSTTPAELSMAVQAGSSAMLADFAPPSGSGSAIGASQPDTAAGSIGLATTSDLGHPPDLMPVLTGH